MLDQRATCRYGVGTCCAGGQRANEVTRFRCFHRRQCIHRRWPSDHDSSCGSRVQLHVIWRAQFTGDSLVLHSRRFIHGSPLNSSLHRGPSCAPLTAFHTRITSHLGVISASDPHRMRCRTSWSSHDCVFSQLSFDGRYSADPS